MKYTFEKLYGSDVEVLVNNETVLFEQVEQTDGVEYSNMWFMNGYVDDEIKYTAIGEYEKGSDDFVELTDIEIYNIDIHDVKKELGIDQSNIAECFDMTYGAFANSSAKKRYEKALVSFYKLAKKAWKKNK